LFIFLVL